MGNLREWATALCMTAIACTILQMLAPKTTNSRWLQVMIAAVFLSCMLLPVQQWHSMSLPEMVVDPAGSSSTDLSDRLEERVIEQSNAAVAALCERYLKNYDITVKKVAVETDSSTEEGIYISCVVLYLDKPNAADSFTVKQLMEQQLGVPVKVVMSEEETAEVQEVYP